MKERNDVELHLIQLFWLSLLYTFFQSKEQDQSTPEEFDSPRLQKTSYRNLHHMISYIWLLEVELLVLPNPNWLYLIEV